MDADIIGYIGGIFSSVSFLPQVIKIWKTRSVNDLSMPTLLLLTCNVSTWLFYGVLIHSRPICITNAIVLSMIFAMIYFKIRFKNNKA
jgi:MtN3 and saliva related transmembrane protein